MIITLEQVRAFRPCYDPDKYGIQSATLTEILEMESIPAADRVWLACRLLTAEQRESFCDFCVSRAMAWAIFAWQTNADAAYAYAAAYATAADAAYAYAAAYATAADAAYAYAAAYATAADDDADDDAADAAYAYAAAYATAAAAYATAAAREQERLAQIDFLIELLGGE